jgi:hypothetical protein
MAISRRQTALTLYFVRPEALASEHFPVPLCNAPTANANVRLPGGGINLLFGRSARSVVSHAMRLALDQGYRPLNARVTLAFTHPQAGPPPLTVDRLATTSLLVLEKTHVSVGLAALIQERLAGYLAEDGTPAPPTRSPIAFALASTYPYLLARLTSAPEFSHLQGLVYTVTGSERGPPARLLYLRDRQAIAGIQSIAIDGKPAFRLPKAKEWAAPAKGYNPFFPERSG